MLQGSPVSESRPVLAAAWMLGAIFSFTLMAVAGRFTAAELDTFELLMYRSFIGIGIVAVMATTTGTYHEITRRNLGLHLVRNIFHFTGQNLWFFALTLIPLAQLIALEFTTPLWVILLAPLLLGERMTRVRVFAVLLGFCGVMVVARPDFSALEIGVLAGAGCAIGFAGSMIFTKMLTRKESITCILFYLVVIQSILGIVTAGWDADIALPSARIWPWVVVVAICGLGAHFSITKALTLAPASIVGPFDFARLPVVAVVAMLVFSEPFDLWVMAGAILIFAANILNIRSESRKNLA